MGKEIEDLKELVKIKDKQIKQLTDKIDQIEDKRLHENEFDFDKLCEKYVDECAMRAMQAFLANPYLQKEFIKDLDKIEKSIGHKFEGDERSKYNQCQHANISYKFAEAMLKEKLERNGKSS